MLTGGGHPLPAKVVARRCGLNLSTAYHLVRTLCYEGYLVRQADGRYVTGSKVAERFHELVESFQRPPAAAAVLQHLAAATDHSAYLARIAADRVVIVDVVEGRHSPWLEDLQVGLETAAHATAVGKSLLTTIPRRAACRPPRVCGRSPATPRPTWRRSRGNCARSGRGMW